MKSYHYLWFVSDLIYHGIIDKNQLQDIMINCRDVGVTKAAYAAVRNLDPDQLPSTIIEEEILAWFKLQHGISIEEVEND
jgi:hypothetical protein